MQYSQEEQNLLDYLTAFRDTTNLVGLAKQAKISRATLNFFLAGQRGLAPAAVAKLSNHLRAQREALTLI